MFSFLKRQTVQDEYLLDLSKRIVDLQNQLTKSQIYTFKLAAKTGYQWKNNRWVKRGI